MHPGWSSLAQPYLEAAGLTTGPPSAAALTWLADVTPPLAASVDRLAEIPERMRQVFAFDAPTALTRDDVRAEASDRWRSRWSGRGPGACAGAPRLTTKDAFRALAKQVGAATGAKGKALFHTIRLATTGEPDGPELDVLIPAIDARRRLHPGRRPRAGDRLPRARRRLRRGAARGDSMTGASWQRDSLRQPALGPESQPAVPMIIYGINPGPRGRSRRPGRSSCGSPTRRSARCARS